MMLIIAFSLLIVLCQSTRYLGGPNAPVRHFQDSIKFFPQMLVEKESTTGDTTRIFESAVIEEGEYPLPDDGNSVFLTLYTGDKEPTYGSDVLILDFYYPDDTSCESAAYYEVIASSQRLQQISSIKVKGFPKQENHVLLYILVGCRLSVKSVQRVLILSKHVKDELFETRMRGMQPMIKTFAPRYKFNGIYAKAWTASESHGYFRASADPVPQNVGFDIDRFYLSMIYGNSPLAEIFSIEDVAPKSKALDLDQVEIGNHILFTAEFDPEVVIASNQYLIIHTVESEYILGNQVNGEGVELIFLISPTVQAFLPEYIRFYTRAANEGVISAVKTIRNVKSTVEDQEYRVTVAKKLIKAAYEPGTQIMIHIPLTVALALKSIRRSLIEPTDTMCQRVEEQGSEVKVGTNEYPEWLVSSEETTPSIWSWLFHRKDSDDDA